jgi:hypothetical protein
MEGEIAGGRSWSRRAPRAGLGSRPLRPVGCRARVERSGSDTRRSPDRNRGPSSLSWRMPSPHVRLLADCEAPGSDTAFGTPPTGPGVNPTAPDPASGPVGVVSATQPLGRVDEGTGPRLPASLLRANPLGRIRKIDEAGHATGPRPKPGPCPGRTILAGDGAPGSTVTERASLRIITPGEVTRCFESARRGCRGSIFCLATQQDPDQSRARRRFASPLSCCAVVTRVRAGLADEIAHPVRQI